MFTIYFRIMNELQLLTGYAEQNKNILLERDNFEPSSPGYAIFESCKCFCYMVSGRGFHVMLCRIIQCPVRDIS